LPYLGSTNVYNAGAGGGTCPGATTYFNSDCTHPTAAAQPYISQIFANSLNYYTGSTFANPYVVTATATLPSAARVTDASGCTAACTLTLPDGTGPSGETYTIITGPTNVVSVQGQTLYGLTQTVAGSSSTVALPPNSTVQLQIVPNAQATAGVHWVITQIALTNVPLLNASNTFTGTNNTFSWGAGALSINGGFSLGSSQLATSSNNYNAPSMVYTSNFWNGTASALDQWFQTEVLGTGANPSSTLTFSHFGSSGAVSVSFPGPVTAPATPQAYINNSSTLASGLKFISGSGSLASGSLTVTFPASPYANTPACTVSLVDGGASAGATLPSLAFSSKTASGFVTIASDASSTLGVNWICMGN